jgi:hypothetical protein
MKKLLLGYMVWLVTSLVLPLLKLLHIGSVSGWGWLTVLAPIWGVWLLTLMAGTALVLVGRE